MLHDNSSLHAAHATRDTLSRFSWGVLDHPPHSPDFSPCDIFGPLKKTLKSRLSITMRRFVRQWNSGSSSNPCLCGGYNETCALLEQMPKEWWLVPVCVWSLWCSGCCQIYIGYVSGPLSMFHLNNPYINVRLLLNNKFLDLYKSLVILKSTYIVEVTTH
jgi:hypothetical protein